MSERTTEFATTLLYPDEYAKHLNEVARLTTQEITLLKRKFVSTAGWELVTLPVSDCVSIDYRDERPLAVTVLGALLLVVLASVGYGLAVYWDDLAAGTRIPIGLLALAAAYAIRMTFMSRRHRLIFSMRDGAKLVWKTNSGDYEFQRPRAEQVVGYARSRGLLREAG